MDQLLVPAKGLKTPSSNLSCVNEGQSELESQTVYPKIQIFKSDDSKEDLDTYSQGTHNNIDFGPVFGNDSNRNEMNEKFLNDDKSNFEIPKRFKSSVYLPNQMLNVFKSEVQLGREDSDKTLNDQQQPSRHMAIQGVSAQRRKHQSFALQSMR